MDFIVRFKHTFFAGTSLFDLFFEVVKIDDAVTIRPGCGWRGGGIGRGGDFGWDFWWNSGRICGLSGLSAARISATRLLDHRNRNAERRA